MTQPSAATFLKEGSACVLKGKSLGWKNCTCLSCAMGMYKSTLGRVNMSGCAVRDETGDYVGGTTLVQMHAIASAHGIATELHVGGNVASLWYASYQGAMGRGFELNGNCQPDGRGNVNHDVWVNHPIGGTPGDPVSFMVYDPWSSGPAVWSYAKLKAFALALRPWGEADPRTLKSMGVNGVYCLIYPDTEPHVHLRYGAVRTTPFPDHQVIKSPGAGNVNVRTGPGKKYPIAPGYANGVKTGSPFTAFQHKADGGLDNGSRGWDGDHDGKRWVHESGLTGKGGTS